MPIDLKRTGKIAAWRLKQATAPAIGAATVGLFKLARRGNPERMADFGAALMRRVGPLLREHRIGRANLRAAYPDKSDAEIEAILRGVWDNLGRVGAEFAHLDRMWGRLIGEQPMRIAERNDSIARLFALRDDGKPALIFSAHLANWELSALVAAGLGLDTTVLYRRPNLAAVADAVVKLRAGCMGKLIPTSIEAPAKLAQVLEAGGHVALLVDQYNVQGVDVTFFGRRTKANPTLARLARLVECPIHGSRVIRLPGHRFEVELTPAIAPARDASGRIDVAATMQIVTSVVEGWIREHPEQWLWVHRRWRD
jgi:KDO2-lipid IV(A) lauroyltransferase